MFMTAVCWSISGYASMCTPVYMSRLRNVATGEAMLHWLQVIRGKVG